MVKSSGRFLVLWDIDHTLIETRGVGRKLYHRAFEAVTGRAIAHDVDVTGRTELSIFAEALRLHGMTPNDGLIDRYRTELAHQYELNAEQLRAHGATLPGAARTLATLAHSPTVVQTVLTGNLRAVAVIKLRAFDLDQYVDFEVGSYGEDDPERPRLVAIAQQRAGTRYRARFDRSNTVLIGDSVQDVQAAHGGGARLIAVASGRDTADELRRAGADQVLSDLASAVPAIQKAMDRTEP
jgi:phosphoglycolate phosphatase-like HAD superfamily hydrolase